MPVAIGPLCAQPNTRPIAASEVGQEEFTLLAEDHGMVRRDGAILHEHQVIVVPAANGNARGWDVHLVPSQWPLIKENHLFGIFGARHCLRQHLELCFPKLDHEPNEHLEMAMRSKIEECTCGRSQISDAELAIDVADFTVITANTRLRYDQSIRCMPSDSCALLSNSHHGALKRPVGYLQLESHATANLAGPSIWLDCWSARGISVSCSSLSLHRCQRC
mmetsp:Transcript_98273/g.184779  ORF Transcript_98273/g.184779 Transcript_98273/m.184779 type:complete len:220 (-) Transcript_98273:146-805(-)